MRTMFSIDVKIVGTAYIKAYTEQEARDKLSSAIGGQLCGIEVQDTGRGDIPVHGGMYDDPELPEVSISPAMTVYAPSGATPVFVAEEDIK